MMKTMMIKWTSALYRERMIPRRHLAFMSRERPMLTYQISMRKREKACECREKYQYTTKMIVYLSNVLLNKILPLKEIEF